MAERVFSSIPDGVFNAVAVVNKSEEVLRLACARGFSAVRNTDIMDGVSVTIRLGLFSISDDIGGHMFAVCDQPYLTRESIKKLFAKFCCQYDKIFSFDMERQA